VADIFVLSALSKAHYFALDFQEDKAEWKKEQLQ